MTIEQLRKELKQIESGTQKFLRDEMPRITGRLAVNHYQANFRKGGFVDETLDPWPVTRRQLSGAARAGNKYGPLLSRRNHLMKSTGYETSDFRARVFNDATYAPIHNWGGKIPVTDKMRGYMWYQYMKASGKLGNSKNNALGISTKKKRNYSKATTAEAEKWRRLALSIRNKNTIHIPQRQFLGPSSALTRQIIDKGEKELYKKIYKIIASNE